MTDGTWSPAYLGRIGAARELEIAARKADGTLRRPVPIWVVCAETEVFVRTWYRRDTGWYGQVLCTHRARIRAGDLDADVSVTEVGPGSREAVDAAYRAKYGQVESMVDDSAAATTLRLHPL